MQLWPPPVSPATLDRQVWDTPTARALPGVGRALALYGTLISQMGLDDVRGVDVLPRPRVLAQPDVDVDWSTYVATKVHEYLLDGNTCDLVTTWDRRTGLPAAVKWFPSSWWQVWGDETTGLVRYYLRGHEVPAEHVIHHRRGLDPAAPWRGVGVVEQHLKSFDRAGLEEEYERSTLRGAGVPSVAIIAPQKQLEPDEADAAADRWMDKFGGPTRRPAILPNGTTVQTLAWNPTDQQLVLARKLTQVDLALIFNLDPYWLGAEGSSHTYRSPGAMFVALIRTALEGVLGPLEGVWSERLLPYGRRARFDRLALTRDDLASAVTSGVQATGAHLMTVNEWRTQNGLPPSDDERADQLWGEIPAALEPPTEDDTEDDPDDEPGAGGDGPTPPTDDKPEEPAA